MKEFLKAFRAWVDDPMTQLVLSALGVCMLFGAVDRAGRLAADAQDSADEAHERIDKLERHWPMRVVS